MKLQNKKNIKIKKRRDKGTIIFLICMMILPYLQGVVLGIARQFITISMMFRDEYGTKFGFFWINWAFKDLFEKGSNMQTGLLIGIKVIALNILIITPLQLVISFFFARKIPLANTLRIIFYLPGLLSSVVTALVFRFMSDNSFGPLRGFFTFIFHQNPLEGFLYSPNTAFPMVMIYIVWLGLGGATIILTGAIKRIPEELLESARLDGALLRHEFFFIVVPMCSQILSVYFLGNLMSGFSIYAEVVLLTDPAQSNLYTIAYILTETAKAKDYYRAAGMGFVFTLIAVPLVVVTRWASNKLPDVSC